MTLTLTQVFLYIAVVTLAITAIRYFLNKPLSLPVAYVQNFVGAFFIFSGFVKAIDPLGTSYKINEYFTEFGMQFLEPYTLAFSVITIVLEIVIGVTLLLGYLRDITVGLLLLLIIFFTFLTGYTTITGHVTDCGCFGDFLKIEPKYSFYKDIFLSVLILFLVVRRKNIEPLFSNAIAMPVTALATIGFAVFCYRNFAWNEPIFDFRPYKVGKNIPAQMKAIKPKVVEYVWEYKNKQTSELKKFSDKEFAQVSKEAGFKDTWAYSNREDIVIDPGIPAPISNFAIFNENGEEITDHILYEETGYQFLVIAYDLDKTHPEAFAALNTLSEASEKAGIPFFAVSAAGPDQRETFRHEQQTPYPFYEADGTFLKTIVRSNPGLLLIKEGNVIGKWHHKHFPTFEELKKDYLK
ncbi:MAG: hypothetical protein SH857_02915 [Chitinophagales bacterium]|nr:hypothetical protein [Chitinophagales bacterium]